LATTLHSEFTEDDLRQIIAAMRLLERLVR
jgi:hypothetical protein